MMWKVVLGAVVGSVLSAAASAAPVSFEGSVQLKNLGICHASEEVGDMIPARIMFSDLGGNTWLSTLSLFFPPYEAQIYYTESGRFSFGTFAPVTGYAIQDGRFLWGSELRITRQIPDDSKLTPATKFVNMGIEIKAYRNMTPCVARFEGIFMNVGNRPSP